MKIARIALLMLFVVRTLTFAQTDEQMLLQLEEEFRVARLNNGTTALNRLSDKDLQDLNQFGQSNDLASFITLFSTFKPTRIQNSDLKVKLAGNTAIVTGKQLETSTSNLGKDQFLQFTHVWIKRENEWKLLFIQQQFDPKEGTVTPKGWNGNSNVNFLIGTDEAIKYSGNASAFIKSKHNQDSLLNTGLGQQIRADNYRGKRIRLNGWVKGNVNFGYAHCWMRIDAEDGEVLSFDNTLDEGNVLRPDWARFSIVLDVPEKSAVIYLGFQLVGRGQAWLDDWQLEVVGKEIAATNQVPTEARQKQIETQRNMNKAQWEQSVQALKKRLPTLPTAPVNLDFETIK